MGRASRTGLVGYRLVRTFRTELFTAVYDAYTAAMPVLEPPPKTSGSRGAPSPTKPTSRYGACSANDQLI